MDKLIWIAAECPFPPNSGGRLVTWNRLKVLSQKFDIYLYCAIDSSEDISYKKDLGEICNSVFFLRTE